MHKGSPSAGRPAISRRRRLSTRGLLASVLAGGLLLAPPAAAQWTGPTELSTSTSRGADQLVIDANNLGDFAAAWAQSPSDSIGAVVKPSSGSPTVPQMYVGDFDDPDIAIGGNSVGVLAFEDDAGDTSIYAASKASGSSAFTAAAAFSGDGHTGPDAPPSAAQPSVAVNHLGTGMLMFARDYYYPPSYSGIAEAIEGRILLNPAANVWNAGADLNQSVYDPRSTEVSVAADGSAFLGINHFNVGPCWGLDTAVLENNGSGSSDPDQFALDCAGGKYIGIHPSNDRLPNGDIVMAYRHTNDSSVNVLDLSKARASGGSTNLEAAAVRIDDPAGHQRTNGLVLVRTDAAGNAIVVWYDSNTSGENNPESMLARHRPAGGAWGPTEVISSGEDYSGAFDFDVDDQGNGYLVYERTSGSNQEIVASERAAGGTSWTTPELLSENQGIVDKPQIAAAKNGQAFASWIANSNGGVFYAEMKPPDPDPDPDPDPGPGPGPGGNDSTDPQGDAKVKGKAKAGKTIKIKVTSDEDGDVAAAGAQKVTKGKKLTVKLKPARKQVTAGQPTTLKLKPQGKKNKKKAKKLKKAVKSGGKAKAKIKVDFTDEAGNSSREKLTVKLK